MGPVLLDVFIKNLLVKKSTPGKFTGSSTSEIVANVLEGNSAIKKEFCYQERNSAILDSLEK